MKHLFAAFLSLLALLALAAPACADAWQDPPSDRFFESHRGQCTYENRRYYANGKEGFITLWDAPGGSEVRAQYENGEVLWTSCTYRSWALVSRREDRTGTAGWVKLADLYRLYDYISFQEKYGDQFREYGGELGDYALREGEVYFGLWEHPYDSWPRERLEMRPALLDALRGTAGQDGCISEVYIDRNGWSWGFVKELSDIRNFWILLDNPECDGLMCCIGPVDSLDSLIYSGVITAPQTPVPPSRPRAPWIPAGAAVAAGGAAYFLRKFWTKKK